MGNAISGALVRGYSWWKSPKYSGAFSIDGQSPMTADISGNIKIVTDTFGVPHVYAHSRRDLFFAQGFITARERMFSFEVVRRLARGTLSEVVPAALPLDRFSRTLGFHRRARGDIENRIDPEAFADVHAFVNGMNYWLEEHYATPPEMLFGGFPKPARVAEEDFGAVIRLIAVQMSRNWLAKIVSFHLERFIAENSEEEEEGEGSEGQLTINEVLKDLLLNADGCGSGAFKEVSEGTPGRPLGVAEYSALVKTFLASTDGFEPATVSSTVDAEIGFDDGPAADPLSSLPVPSGGEGGSNAFAVSGAYTESGFPILEGDPHLKAQSPSTWLRFHLVCEEESIDCTGFTMVGGYGITIGHNRDAAWSITLSYADCAEVYVQRVRTRMVDDGRGGQGAVEEVLVDSTCDEWAPLRVVEERIRVKSKENPIHIEKVRLTPDCGPMFSPTLMHFKDGDADSFSPLPNGERYELSLRVVCCEKFPTGVMRDDMVCGSLLSVRNFSDLEAVAGGIRTAFLNLIYADRHGDIGQIMTGAFPKRRNEAFSKKVGGPVPGWDLNYRWDGYEESQPTIKNPRSGILVSANHNSFSFERDFHDGEESDSELREPFYLSTLMRVPIRAGRIRRLIEDVIQGTPDTPGRKFTIEDAMRIPLDVTNSNVGVITRFAAYALGDDSGELKGERGDAFDQKVIDLAARRVSVFDGVFTPDSVSAALYTSFVTFLLISLLEHFGLPKDKQLFEHMSGRGWTPKFMGKTSITCVRELMCDRLFYAVANDENKRDIVRLSFFKTVHFLESLLSESKRDYAALHRSNQNYAAYLNLFEWGQFHVLKWDHPLASVVPSFAAAVEVGGTWDTPMLTSYDTDGKTNMMTGEYPTARFVCDLGDVENAQSGIFPGNSAHWGSKFFHDGVELWKENGGYRKMMFSNADLERNTYGVLTFEKNDSVSE